MCCTVNSIALFTGQFNGILEIKQKVFSPKVSPPMTRHIRGLHITYTRTYIFKYIGSHVFAYGGRSSITLASWLCISILDQRNTERYLRKASGKYYFHYLFFARKENGKTFFKEQLQNNAMAYRKFLTINSRSFEEPNKLETLEFYAKKHTFVFFEKIQSLTSYFVWFWLYIR